LQRAVRQEPTLSRRSTEPFRSSTGSLLSKVLFEDSMIGGMTTTTLRACRQDTLPARLASGSARSQQETALSTRIACNAHPCWELASGTTYKTPLPRVLQGRSRL